ncbi:E3 ubiquitin/ISG15 ligase TRIM25 isoform X1 [Amia ocellicauda]|uniref:E3 ubiquitin/ISG15 ligase TRIM25 isoform X1 n=1 Tax=Amia ocellicauda TaxID=2972642 RepID=UPI003463F27A
MLVATATHSSSCGKRDRGGFCRAYTGVSPICVGYTTLYAERRKKSTASWGANMEPKCLEEELTCAICLGLYREPVVLPCQHTFCRRCIRDYWANKGHLEIYDCPQCRSSFPRQPSLEKNFTLCNIVEKLWAHKSHRTALLTGVTCDFCADGSSQASKTCLKCETSFCAFHLQAHLTKLNPREHRLVDPLTTFSNRKCAEHGKALEFYCREDQCCVCVSCSVLGCHRNHAVASLEEAASEALKDEIAGLHKELFSFSIMKLDLKKAEAEFKVYVDSLTKLTSQNFRELQKRLQEDEQYMLREITSKRNSVLARVKEQCKQIDRAAENKKLRESNIQDMMNRDPFSLIQSTDHSINWDTKTKDFLEAHIADLSLDKEEVLKIVKDRLDETQIYHSAIWNIMNSRSLNFDVNSAHPNLIISEDGKTVSWSDSRQPYLPHEERFNFDSQVLCSNVFSSGTHSWDVWVNGESFKLGIAYCSLDRKKLLPSFLGHNSVSWCISYIKGDIKAWHQNICTNVAQINDPTCIRVQLDYESGTVSFFYLTDTLIHLYTFKTTFSEPVYPAFKCGNNTSIKLS